MLTIQEVINQSKRRVEGKGRARYSYSFPSVYMCWQCGKVRGIYDREGINKKVDCPQVAWGIEMIKAGIYYLPFYDNPVHNDFCQDPILCDEEYMAESLPRISEDSGWIGSKGGRCITDYTRKITFVDPPTDIKAICVYLQKHNCPGWTGVTARKLSEVTYQFYTTMDSSD